MSILNNVYQFLQCKGVKLIKMDGNVLLRKFDLPKNVKKIHFIGIGGSGMFPIVQILSKVGYQITGSDNNYSSIVELERKMGIDVIIGQNPENIKDADMVIYTAAILPDNPELLKAHELSIPVMERAEMLGIISKAYSNAIGISGTHGKTTVTGMLTQIYKLSGREPSALIGGKLKLIDGYGCVGASDTFIYEACEFRDHFLQTYPDVSIILNIDNDHMEYFGTVENAMLSYKKFANMSSKVIYNISDTNTRLAMQDVTANTVTFGWKKSDGAQFYPVNISTSGANTSFTLMRDSEALGELLICIPGEHNILNAVATAATAYEDGIEFSKICSALSSFYGTGRRFEVLGTINGATLVDDYAHHPKELEVTLRAAKTLGYKKIWAVFQPFTFSRTQLLLEDFVKALSIADCVVLSPIMAGREKNTFNISSKDIADKLENAICLPSFEDIADYVLENVKEADLVITLGCGDIYKCANIMLQRCIK